MEKDNNIRLTVDAVLFGYQRPDKLNVLLVKRKYPPFAEHWALPGGFVQPGESLDTAIQRELKEETNVPYNYLEQLYTYGQPNRDPRGHVVSVAYFGLVNPEHFEVAADTDAVEAGWFTIKELPDLAFDHANIIHAAYTRLRAKLTYQPIGFELLTERFPFSALEQLYMTILDKKIDRRNFRKKILKFGILNELDELAPAQGSGRRGHLFEFNKEKYFELVKTGFVFEI